MQRSKFLAAAAMFVLVAGAFFSSQAQESLSVDRIMPPVRGVGGLTGTLTSAVEATEINAGELNEVSNEMYGWTLGGTTEGDLTGHLFLSVNYTWSSFGVIEAGNVTPAVTNIICGGSWSKLIYVKGVYQGSISGRILDGTMTWDEKSQKTMMVMNLASDTGTGAYEGIVGSGSFEGSMDRMNKPVPTISGTLTLKY